MQVVSFAARQMEQFWVKDLGRLYHVRFASRKQSTAALSSCEAELVAGGWSTDSVKWLDLCHI